MARCELLSEPVGGAHLPISQDLISRTIAESGFDNAATQTRTRLLELARESDISAFVNATVAVVGGHATWESVDALWRGEPSEWAASLVGLLRSRLANEGNECPAAYPDVRDANALTRGRHVTTWELNGSPVVAKRRTPAGVRQEIGDRDRLVDVLGLEPTGYRLMAGRLGPIKIIVPSPNVVCSADEGAWICEPKLDGPTMEAALLREPFDPMLPYMARELSSELLDHGMFWGDLSPRNLIIGPNGANEALGLIDFEKMRFVESPASRQTRLEFIRAGAAIEEFGPWCSPSVVSAIFGTWWLGAGHPHNPRRELEDMLRRRGVDRESPRLVDELDDLIWLVRRPRGYGGRKVYPGGMNIRLQHYLYCLGVGSLSYTAEHALTAGLVRSYECGSFRRAVEVIDTLVNHVEDLALAAEVYSRRESPLFAFTDRVVAGYTSPVISVVGWLEEFASAPDKAGIEGVLDSSPAPPETAPK